MVHRSGSACFSPQRSPNVTGPDMNLIKEPEPDCLPLMDAGRLPNDDPLQDTAYTANTANYHPTPILVSAKTEPSADMPNVAPNVTTADKTVCRPEHSLRCRLPLNKLRRILHKIRPLKRNINATNLVPKTSDLATLTDRDVVVDVSDTNIVPSAGIECDKLADPCAFDETDTKTKTKTGVLTVDRVLCLYCDRSFATASLQNRHVQRVHRENPGRRSSGRTAHLQTQGDFNGCGFCSETAIARSTNLLDLFAHLVDKHTDKYFACQKCIVRFTTSESLNIHLSEVHGQSVDLKVVLRNKDAENITDKGVRKVVSPELQVEDSNAIDFEQSIAVNILSIGITGSVEQKTSPKLIVTESNNLPQTKVSQKPQKMGANNSAQEQNEPMLSRLGITQNRSPGTKKSSKMRKNDLKSALNDKKIKVKPDVQEFFINKNINSKNELFDSRFDKNFYENVSKNVNENLSNYLDGKINNIPGMSAIDSVVSPVLTADNENRVRIHESNSSLSTISSFPTLLSSEQYGAIGPPNNPKLPRKKATKNSWKWKFDFVKKYKYYNENGKMVKKVKPTYQGTRDLSKLDMWTQLTMRNKYDLEKSKDKQNNEEEQTECNERKEKLRLLGELNSILDTRLFPKLNLEQECSPVGIKKEPECHIEKSENEVKFTRRKSCRINDICASLAKVTASNISTKTVPDDHKIDSLYYNKQNSNVKENTSVPPLDSFQPTIDSVLAHFDSNSSTEDSFSNYLNLKPKTDIPNTPISPELYLSGEWERPRCYICVGCGLKLNTLKELEDHKSSEHPHIFSTYYEIVGKEMINSEVYKLFHLPGAQNTGKLLVEVKQSNSIAKGPTGDNIECTKCSKSVALSERFRHMLECSGDYAYLLAKKKSRYRPFGSRSRRRKARLHGCKVPRRMPTTVIKKIRRNTKNNIPRSKPSDAETIQRMLANLPAKRLSRHIVPLPRPRQRLKKQAQIKQNTNVQQPKNLPGNRHLHNRASRSRTFLQAGGLKPTWTELQRLKNSKQTRITRKTTMSKRYIKTVDFDTDTDVDVDVETLDVEDSVETDTESVDIDVETIDIKPVFKIPGIKKLSNKTDNTTNSSNTKRSKTLKAVILNKNNKEVQGAKTTSKTNVVQNNNKIQQKSNTKIKNGKSQDIIKKTSLNNTILPKSNNKHKFDIKKDKVDINSIKNLNKPKQNLKGKTSTIIDVTDYKKNRFVKEKSNQKTKKKINSKKNVELIGVSDKTDEKKIDKVINKISTENTKDIASIISSKDVLPSQDGKSAVVDSKVNPNAKIKLKGKKLGKQPEANNLKEKNMSRNKNKSSAKKSDIVKEISRNSAIVEDENLKDKELDSTNNIAKDDDPDSDSKSDDFPLAHIKMRFKNKSQIVRSKSHQGRKNKVYNRKLKCKTNPLTKKLPIKSKRKCKLTDNLKENIITVNECITSSVKKIESDDKETKCCIIEKALNDSDIMPTLEKISPVSSEKSEDTCPILSPIVDNTSRRVAPLLLKSNCAQNITPLLDPKLFDPEIEGNLKTDNNPKSKLKESEQNQAIEKLMDTEISQMETILCQKVTDIDQKETKLKQNQIEIDVKETDVKPNEEQKVVSEKTYSVKKDLAQTEIKYEQSPIILKAPELNSKTITICDISKSTQLLDNSPTKLIQSPIKRRSKKLNDCIAMLTDKLHSKLSDNHINSYNVLQSYQVELKVINSDTSIISNDKEHSSASCNEKLDNLPHIKDITNAAAATECVEELHESISIPSFDTVNAPNNEIGGQQLIPEVNNLISEVSELKETAEENVKCTESHSIHQVVHDVSKFTAINIIHEKDGSLETKAEKIVDSSPLQIIESSETVEQESADHDSIIHQALSQIVKGNELELNQEKKGKGMKSNTKFCNVKNQKKKYGKSPRIKITTSKCTRKSIPEVFSESTICDNIPFTQNYITPMVENEFDNTRITSLSDFEDKLFCNEQEYETTETQESNSDLSQSNHVLENGVTNSQNEITSYSSSTTRTLVCDFECTESQNENTCNENELFISSLSANDEQYIQNALEIPNVLLNSSDEILNNLEVNKPIPKTKSRISRKKKENLSIEDKRKILERSPVSFRKSTPRKCKFSLNVTNIENEVEDIFSETLTADENEPNKTKGNVKKHKKKISPFNDCSLIANEQLNSSTIALDDQLESDVQEGNLVEINPDGNNDSSNQIFTNYDTSTNEEKSLENNVIEVSNLMKVIENINSDAKQSSVMTEQDFDCRSSFYDSEINSDQIPNISQLDNETNSTIENVCINKNEKSDTFIENTQNITNGFLDDIGVNVKSDNLENSDSEEDMCLAVIAKILQNKPEINIENKETCNTMKENENINNSSATSTKLQNENIRDTNIDVHEENARDELLCTKMSYSESIADSLNDSIASLETIKVRKKRRYKKSVLFNSRKNKQLKSEKYSEVMNNLLNYCEICKKSFQRIESLNKHKMTLTHIAKLSEIEFLNKKNNSKNDDIENDISGLNDVIVNINETDSDKTPTEEKSENLCAEPQLLSKEIVPQENLNQTEKIDDKIINNLCENISDNSGLSAVNELGDINNRKALSVEEQLFFECCSLLKSSEATKNEMAPEPKTLGANPYPILPSATETHSLKLSHYSNKFSDISSDSNNLPTIQNMDLPKLQEDSCGSNLTAFLASVDKFISTPLINHAENNEYSPISNNANFSPISNSRSPDKLDNFETDFKLQEPSQTIVNNFSPISDQSESENVTCNIYTKTISTITLQETYMKSDEISSICDIRKEFRSPLLETNIYKSREELYSVENMIIHSNSDTFSDMGYSCPPSVGDSDDGSEIQNQELPQSNHLCSEDVDFLLENEHDRICRTDLNNSVDLLHKGINIQENEPESVDLNISLPSSPQSNKKIPTKGALKVFESLKVSIPTSEFNLKKVISSCANSKLAAFVEIALQSEQSNDLCEENEFPQKVVNLKNNTSFITDDHTSKNINIDRKHEENDPIEFNPLNSELKEKPEVNHIEEITSVAHKIKVKEVSPKKQNSPRKQDSSMLPNCKKKNLVLTFGNNLGFRIKKKRINNKRKHKTNNKSKNKISNKHIIKDIYDFEDSQDNIDFSSNKLTSYVSNKFSSKCDILNNTNIDSLHLHNGEDQANSGNIPVSDDDDDGFDYLSDHLTDISSVGSTEVAKSRIDIEGNPKQLIVGKIFRKNLKEKPEKPNLDELFDNLLSENIENTKCGDTQLEKDENELLDESKVTNEILNENVNSTENQFYDEENLKEKDLSKNQERAPLKTKSRKNRSKSTIEQELGMSFQQIKEIIGFAQRKSQRKCTTGKQNVLAENWSSDEDFGSKLKKDKTKIEKRIAKENIEQKLHVKPKIKNEDSIAVIPATDNISICPKLVQDDILNNKLEQNKNSEYLSNLNAENDFKDRNGPAVNGFSEKEHGNFINNAALRIKRRSHRDLPHDSSSDSECESKKKRSRKARRRRRMSSGLKDHQAKLNTAPKALDNSQNESIAPKTINDDTIHNNALMETLASSINVETLASNNKRGKQSSTDLDAQTAAILSLPRRKRVSTDMLYYWSSSSDEDQYAGMIEVKPIRDDVNLTEHPIQHGWIVGDSHKKLVTLLAHTKGKKTEDCVVKESNIKKNRHTL